MGANPWTYIFLFILVLTAGILLMSVLYSLLIAHVAAHFSDKTMDKYQKELQKMLPGTDCGKCKFKTCAEYADAVLHTEAPEDACPCARPGTPEAMVAARERLQKSMEDPTPPEKNEPRFWERKF